MGHRRACNGIEIGLAGVGARASGSQGHRFHQSGAGRPPASGRQKRITSSYLAGGGSARVEPVLATDMRKCPGIVSIFVPDGVDTTRITCERFGNASGYWADDFDYLGAGDCAGDCANTGTKDVVRDLRMLDEGSGPHG